MHLGPLYGTWPVGYRADWAVPGFLSISGYYVLRSYEQSSSWRDFIAKRALRVLPAFAISAAVVALVSVKNLAPLMLSYVTFGIVEHPRLTNGPIWSLGVEEVAYAILVVLFALGAYKKVWPIWLAFAIACIAASLIAAPTADDHVMRITDTIPAFFAGSLIYLYRDRIRGESTWGLILIVAAIAAYSIHVDKQPFAWWWWVPGTAMGVGILSMRRLKVPRIPDLSYGCYIYHMPLYSLLIWPWWGYFPALVALCGASWFFAEKPALSLKSHLARRRTPQLQPQAPLG
jgi:peptidoglycan/LPS O-acetylase OafA/YrhL